MYNVNVFPEILLKKFIDNQVERDSQTSGINRKITGWIWLWYSLCKCSPRDFTIEINWKSGRSEFSD